MKTRNSFPDNTADYKRQVLKMQELRECELDFEIVFRKMCDNKKCTTRLRAMQVLKLDVVRAIMKIYQIDEEDAYFYAEKCLQVWLSFSIISMQVSDSGISYAIKNGLN